MVVHPSRAQIPASLDHDHDLDLDLEERESEMLAGMLERDKSFSATLRRKPTGLVSPMCAKAASTGSEAEFGRCCVRTSTRAGARSQPWHYDTTTKRRPILSDFLYQLRQGTVVESH